MGGCCYHTGRAVVALDLHDARPGPYNCAAILEELLPSSMPELLARSSQHGSSDGSATAILPDEGRAEDCRAALGRDRTKKAPDVKRGLEVVVLGAKRSIYEDLTEQNLVAGDTVASAFDAQDTTGAWQPCESRRIAMLASSGSTLGSCRSSKVLAHPFTSLQKSTEATVDMTRPRSSLSATRPPPQGIRASSVPLMIMMGTGPDGVQTG